MIKKQYKIVNLPPNYDDLRHFMLFPWRFTQTDKYLLMFSFINLLQPNKNEVKIYTVVSILYTTIDANMHCHMCYHIFSQCFNYLISFGTIS